MFKDAVLANLRRKEIYNFVRRAPGFHLRELQRRLKIPLSSLEHHIDYMIRHNVLYKEKDGRYVRYFAGGFTKEERKLITALRHRRLREIVLIILENGDVKFQDLKDCLDLPASTLSHFLKYLVDRCILKRQKAGYENIYSIQDQRVGKVLVIYEPSFTDRVVDKVSRAFMETDFKNANRKSVKNNR
jgi:predicted transcriptional regulator